MRGTIIGLINGFKLKTNAKVKHKEILINPDDANDFEEKVSIIYEKCQQTKKS